MRHLTVILCVSAMVCAVALHAQTPAPKPGPEHKKLEIWIGDWTWESEVHATPFGPAGKSTGKASVRPILGGFFVEWRSEDKGPTGTSQGIEIDGYDPVTKKFTWNFFATDGTTQTVSYSIEGNTVSISGTQVTGGRQANIRGTVVFAPDFMSFVEKREMSIDGKVWMPVYESKCTKVKLSPK